MIFYFHLSFIHFSIVFYNLLGHSLISAIADGFTLAKDVIIIISAVLHILMLWILMAQYGAKRSLEAMSQINLIS